MSLLFILNFGNSLSGFFLGAGGDSELGEHREARGESLTVYFQTTLCIFAKGIVATSLICLAVFVITRI